MPIPVHTRVGRDQPRLYRDRSFADQVYNWNLTDGIIDTAAIANQAVTAALLGLQAQPYNTNLLIIGTAYNAVSWDSGLGTDADIIWADQTIKAITLGSQAGLTDSTSYWAYIDSDLAEPLTLTLTTNYQTAITNGAVLLALIVVGTSASGSKPTILPFTGKVPTISAVAIAANAITADAIAAGSIIAGKLAADSVVANNLDVATLDAISADFGTMTAGTITGVTIQSAAAGDRIILNSGGLEVVGTTQDFTFRLTAGGTVYGYMSLISGTPNTFDILAINSANLRIFADADIQLVGSDDISIVAVDGITLSGDIILISGVTSFTVNSTALILLSTTTGAGNDISLESGDDLNLIAVDDIYLTPGTADQVIVNGGVGLRLTNQLPIRFSDADDSRYVGFRAPSIITNNVIWDLPAADGSSKQVLKTGGSATLSFGWPHLPYCILRRGSTSAIADVTTTTLDWTEDTDPDGMFSAGAPSKITIAVAGTYLITVTLKWGIDADGERQIQVFKNTGEIARTTGSGSLSGNYVTQTISFLYPLAVSDYLEVKGYQSSGGNLDIIGGLDSTWFTVVRVGD